MDALVSRYGEKRTPFFFRESRTRVLFCGNLGSAGTNRCENPLNGAPRKLKQRKAHFSEIKRNIWQELGHHNVPPAVPGK